MLEKEKKLDDFVKNQKISKKYYENYPKYLGMESLKKLRYKKTYQATVSFL